MHSYQHRFPTVEQYLHHRPPYLMVDRVVDLEPRRITTEKRVRGDEFFLAGHFPGAPVFPGAMLHEVTTQSAGILIAAEHNPMREYDTSDPHFNEFALGVLVRTRHARYKSFARPGDVLIATVTLVERIGELFDFEATVEAGGVALMRNGFQLMNIRSSVLTGARAES